MTLAMNMSITKLQIEETLRLYRVDCDNDSIFVTVTHNPIAVTYWVLTSTRLSDKQVRRDGLVIGIRVEWRRSLLKGLWRGLDHEVDILQICIGNRCLFFPIRQVNDNMSRELNRIFCDINFTFVGVGIRRDLDILRRDYKIRFAQNYVDLSELYVMRRITNPWWFWNYYGLRSLTNLVLQKDYVRPLMITMSKWDASLLNEDQIMYACVDAYLCYKIGQFLHAWLI